jgi:hypothetical protein
MNSNYLGDVFVEQNDVIGCGYPECITAGALHDVPGVAVRMHVDLDAGAVVADGAIHRFSFHEKYSSFI